MTQTDALHAEAHVTDEHWLAHPSNGRRYCFSEYRGMVTVYFVKDNTAVNSWRKQPIAARRMYRLLLWLGYQRG